MLESARRVYKHRWPVRLAHWLNVICFFILLGSGLNIFNAHPKLYWGNISHFESPFFAIGARPRTDNTWQGVTQFAGLEFTTTGVLGVSEDASGRTVRVGFPGWSTIPANRNLAAARLWHFFFAWIFVINGVLFLLWSMLSKHYRDDLKPSAEQWRDWRQTVRDHVRFKHAEGDVAARYNLLQKLAYLAVIYVLLPGIVMMGLCLSPHMDSVLGWLLEIVGGRQSARTLHFVFAGALLMFIAIHLLMVLVTGPINQIRSMLSGWFHLPSAQMPSTLASPEACPETSHVQN